MFQERNQARGNRNQLLRRNVHVVNLRGLDFQEVAAITDRHLFTGEMSFRVDRRVRLRDEEVLFAIACQVIDLIGDPAFFDLAIGRLDKSKFVDPRKGAHRADQTDVRTFRRLDRADASVVRRMHVADFETRAITAQTAGPEG